MTLKVVEFPKQVPAVNHDAVKMCKQLLKDAKSGRLQVLFVVGVGANNREHFTGLALDGDTEKLLIGVGLMRVLEQKMVNTIEEDEEEPDDTADDDPK